jgi:hypothetical protein
MKEKPNHECPRFYFFVEERSNIHHPTFLIHEKNTWLRSKKAQVFFVFYERNTQVQEGLNFLMFFTTSSGANYMTLLFHEKDT